MRPTFLALLMIAAPAAGQPPEDLYRQGVQARLAGNAAQAAELLGRAAALAPGNADVQLQLGLALLALNRLEEAEAAFNQTVAIAPDYADARIGLARIAQRRGDRKRALASLNAVASTNVEAEELRRLLSATPAAEGRYRLDLDLSHSELDGRQPEWREAALQLRYQASPAMALTARVEAAHRFSRTDVFGELRVDQTVSEAANVYASIGGTPSADFRPKWQIGLGGSARVRSGGNGTIVTLDARQARFATGDIQTVSPGVEQYLAGGRAWFTARWINIFDEDGSHAGGWIARGDVLATERLRLFAGVADAPDTSEGVVIETFSTFGGFTYGLSDQHEIRFSAAHEDRASGSDRLQLSLGFGARF